MQISKGNKGQGRTSTTDTNSQVYVHAQNEQNQTVSAMSLLLNMKQNWVMTCPDCATGNVLLSRSEIISLGPLENTGSLVSLQMHLTLSWKKPQRLAHIGQRSDPESKDVFLWSAVVR